VTRILERTNSAIVFAALIACVIAGCKRTTAGTAGEGGSGVARPASGSNSATQMSSSGTASASRTDSAAGSVMLNANGSVPRIDSAGGLGATPGATSMFLPTLGTSIRVPTSPAAPASRSDALVSPFIPILPAMNPADSSPIATPPSPIVKPMDTARPNSTVVRPALPGTAAVIRKPQ